MKTRNFETTIESLTVFALTNEEMMTVKGGTDDGPTSGGTTVPIKI